MKTKSRKQTMEGIKMDLMLDAMMRGIQNTKCSQRHLKKKNKKYRSLCIYTGIYYYIFIIIFNSNYTYTLFMRIACVDG